MNDSKNLRYETLYIADYEYVNISSFAVLDIELCYGSKKTATIKSPFIFIQTHSIKGSKLIQNIVIF